MNRIAYVVLAFVALLCAACAGPTASLVDEARPVAARDETREILVTFVDRGLARTPNAAPGQYVRRNSDYQSTTWSRSISADIARDYALQTVAEWPIRSLGVHCVVYSVGNARSVDDVLELLGRDRRIEAAQRMNSFRVMSSDDPYRSLQTSLNTMQVEAVRDWATGRNVSVAIVDSGVDADHPDLRGQVRERADLTDSRAAFGDDIHGTAVAGIIGALSSNGVGIAGIAPDASLLALRACWPEHAGEIAAVCNSLTLAKALDTAILRKPHVINLSLTGPGDPLVEALLRTALDAGIVVVAAEPATSPDAGFAAAVEGVIRVRAVEEDGSAPPRGVIAAPGSEVLTTFPGGTYSFASGSSFAAANVSGIVALLLELRAELSPAEVQALLGDEPGGSDGNLAASAAVLVNACRAATRLRPAIVCREVARSAPLARRTVTDRRAAPM